MSLENQLNELEKQAKADFKAASDDSSWNQLRVKYLGKKSEIQSLLKGLGKLDPQERPQAGQMINKMRQSLEGLCEASQKALQERQWESLAQTDTLDITEPALALPKGRQHPLTQVQQEVEDIFLSMGFDVLDGPEVETEFYNFEALNIPADHPARDMQDTFWLTNGQLLRTHTSNVQIRAMQSAQLPLRAIAPGRVFRHEESDASHEHTFHQVEGLLVDKEVSVAELIGVVRAFLSHLFAREVEVRLRPGYFPFVEPGFEVDFACLLCKGSGCSACKKTGWLEFMGAGLVHPHVFEACDLKADQWTGFAFGFGLERLTMMRYGITDIRHFHGSDLRFLEQF